MKSFCGGELASQFLETRHGCSDVIMTTVTNAKEEEMSHNDDFISNCYLNP